METTIRDIKVWYDTRIKDKSNREYRIYVHTNDGREGCYYLDGNKWHTAKSFDGKLTEAEWSQARKIGYYDEKWHTLYENQIHPVERKSNSSDTERRNRCPDCGGYDCGANCNSNRTTEAHGDGFEHARWETEESLSNLGL